jgi:cell division septation protein DedD
MMQIDSLSVKLSECRAAVGILIVGSVFLFMIGAFATLQAQESLEAYDKGRMFEAYSRLNDASTDSVEALFLRAAAIADADSAVEIYRQIVLGAPESEIARRAMDRIRAYYYAQGLYVRAQELEETLGDWRPPERRLRTAESTPPPPFSLESILQEPPESAEIEPEPEAEPEVEQPQPVVEESSFVLQVGAFRSATNANKLKQQLEDAGYLVQILAPDENQYELHLVRVIGFKEVGEAFDAAEAIQAKFNIQPIVVPGG